MARLVFRCAVLLLTIYWFVSGSPCLQAAEPGQFFRDFSPLHLLWAYWMYDMIAQLIPIGHKKALGSRKVYAAAYRPSGTAVPQEQLRAVNKRACLVAVIWTALIAVLGVLHAVYVLSNAALLLIAVFFYLCDLICVLIWCPFRLLLGNRCCTSCRIFNWDHLMMFSPLVFVGGFFAHSLFFMALLSFSKWEWTVYRHPERFLPQTNASLRCTNCTDKLCTQYCGRKKA